MPKESKAYYFDSMKREKKNYTLLKKVLDDALFDFAHKGGTVAKRSGGPRFKHVTDFCCRQQPENSVTCGYYVCSHMDDFVRARNTLCKAEDLRKWSNNLEHKPYDWKQEFARYQNVFANIINKDVVLDTGLFYAGNDAREEHAARSEQRARQIQALFNTREDAVAYTQLGPRGKKASR